MTVSIRALSKHFGDTRALDDLSIQFKPNAITVLLGASGCGKTTTLRCIAGLEQPSSGEIEIDGNIVYSSERNIDLPPEKRKLGMVFQSYAIWPHLSVHNNVALPLLARGAAAREVAERVFDTLKSVGLSAYADRSATQLSGGQQQRVSIARCLVADPSLILMDEPLSNLDAKLRVEMRQEIRSLQRRLGATILFVTHDQEEAMSLGDEIFLFDKGRVVQRGAPEELYFRPAARYVAEFLGKANLFKVALGRADGQRDGHHALLASSGQIIAKNYTDVGSVSGDAEALCMIRPEAWRVTLPGAVGQRGAEGAAGDIHSVNATTIPGRIRSTSFVGDRRELNVETSFGDQVVVTPGFERFAEGDQIHLSVAAENLHLIRGQQ